MQFTLTLSLDNADARYEDGSLSYHAASNYIEQAAKAVYAGCAAGNVRDSNGNTIGHYEITGD